MAGETVDPFDDALAQLASEMSGPQVPTEPYHRPPPAKPPTQEQPAEANAMGGGPRFGSVQNYIENSMAGLSRIPEDIVGIGFDDILPILKSLPPAGGPAAAGAGNAMFARQIPKMEEAARKEWLGAYRAREAQRATTEAAETAARGQTRQINEFFDAVQSGRVKYSDPSELGDMLIQYANSRNIPYEQILREGAARGFPVHRVARPHMLQSKNAKGRFQKYSPRVREAVEQGRANERVRGNAMRGN